MRISIALETCEGQTFLREQLESFLYQTRLPDELIACDDASHDSTYDLLREFVQKAPFPVRLKKNANPVYS